MVALSQGRADFEVKVNVLTSMRKNSLFRIGVFPVNHGLCNAHPKLFAVSPPIKTLCKPARGSSASAGPAAAKPSNASQPRPTADLARAPAPSNAAITVQRAAEQQQRSNRLAAPATADPLAAIALEMVSDVPPAEALLQMEGSHRSKALADRDMLIRKLTALNAALVEEGEKLRVLARRSREPEGAPAGEPSGEPSPRRHKNAHAA
jgi:hypothetical protein